VLKEYFVVLQSKQEEDTEKLHSQKSNNILSLPKTGSSEYTFGVSK
jgi:hypothetical protein